SKPGVVGSSPASPTNESTLSSFSSTYLHSHHPSWPATPGRFLWNTQKSVFKESLSEIGVELARPQPTTARTPSCELKHHPSGRIPTDGRGQGFSVKRTPATFLGGDGPCFPAVERLQRFGGSLQTSGLGRCAIPLASPLLYRAHCGS